MELDEHQPSAVAPPLMDLTAETPPDDGMAVNKASPWVRDKLRVATKYDPAFCTACRKWDDMFYVDAFAGSGVNVIAEEGGTRLWGTPVIARLTTPESLIAASWSSQSRWREGPAIARGAVLDRGA